MISKTTTGTGFKSLLEYCLKEEKNAEILELNGLTRKDSKGLTVEFNNICEENKNISKPVWHSSLSFPKADNITVEKMRNIAVDFINKLGFSKENHQYVIIQHKDKDHVHCHIVANRVSFEGKAVSDYYCKSKAVSIAKQLEVEYKLSQVQEISNAKKQLKDRFATLDPNKKHIITSIDTALKSAGVDSFPKLASELKKMGIEMQILKHSKTGKEFGANFKFKDKVFKGSDLGKKYAFKALTSQLEPTLKTVVKIISKGIDLGI